LAAGAAYARRRRPYRRQPCPRVTVAGRPLAGGLGRSRPGRGWSTLHGGWPWLAAPPPCCLHCKNAV
ncbi:hypothetical protein B296_00058587, partial [Ensete ventricosum]